MIDRSWAEGFAREWASNWHAEDLDALTNHYSSDVVFRSPRISVVLGKQQASVSGLSEIRDYWRKVLDIAKEVRFEIRDVGGGGDAVAIFYRNQRNDDAAETLVFNEDGKVIEGIVVYLRPPEG